MIRTLPINNSTLIAEIPYSLMAALLLGFLANAGLFMEDQKSLLISRIDGVILLIFMGLFLIYLLKISRENGESLGEDEIDESLSRGKATFFVILGMVGLFVGGGWVVSGAIYFASSFGLSQSLIGLTVVAVGTSLPELITSAVAAYKGKTDIAVGNVVGSNIFNIVGILGVVSLINPIPFDLVSNADLVMVIISSLMVFFVIVFGKKAQINRMAGLIFFCSYVFYIAYIVHRG